MWWKGPGVGCGRGKEVRVSEDGGSVGGEDRDESGEEANPGGRGCTGSVVEGVGLLKFRVTLSFPVSFHLPRDCQYFRLHSSQGSSSFSLLSNVYCVHFSTSPDNRQTPSRLGRRLGRRPRSISLTNPTPLSSVYSPTE